MTESEAKEMYIKMIHAYANEGPKKIESMILSLGRTDMQVLCAYLFARGLKVELDLQKMKEVNG